MPHGTNNCDTQNKFEKLNFMSYLWQVALVAASKRIEGLEKEVSSLRQRLAQSKAKGSRRAKDEDTTGKIRDFGYILSRFDVHFAVVVTPNSCDQKCAR